MAKAEGKTRKPKFNSKENSIRDSLYPRSHLPQTSSRDNYQEASETRTPQMKLDKPSIGKSGERPGNTNNPYVDNGINANKSYTFELQARRVPIRGSLSACKNLADGALVSLDRGISKR